VQTIHYTTIDSTNAEAKRRVLASLQQDELPFDLIITADEQTAGHGRRGRPFYSPAASSLYMSIILKPDLENLQMLTIAAAVAVCRAIEEGMHGVPQVKWVNDVFADMRKVCGILAEIVTDPHKGKIAAVVLGIGININVDEDSLPGYASGIAGSLAMSTRDRETFEERITAGVYKYAEMLRTEEDRAEVMEAYRSYSMMQGRSITVLKGGEQIPATAAGIAGDGGLIVKYETGYAEVLHSGEVSIKIS
jgi:BirA family biotin operon repressor/biotin-[acetyl-CoA-carboxylase] ligase